MQINGNKSLPPRCRANRRFKTITPTGRKHIVLVKLHIDEALFFLKPLLPDPPPHTPPPKESKQNQKKVFQNPYTLSCRGRKLCPVSQNCWQEDKQRSQEDQSDEIEYDCMRAASPPAGVAGDGGARGDGAGSVAGAVANE